MEDTWLISQYKPFPLLFLHSFVTHFTTNSKIFRFVNKNQDLYCNG